MSLVRVFAKMFAQKLIREHEEETAMIDTNLRAMTDSDRYFFYKKYDKQKKSLATAYFFYLFGFGGHYLYLDRYKTQLLFWGTLGGGFIWYGINAATMFYIVDKYNRDLAFKIMGEIWEHSSPSLPQVPDTSRTSDGLTFVPSQTPTPIKLMASPKGPN